MNRFTGRSVLVTGAASGIGLASACAFAAEGARVVITGRNAEALEQARRMVGNGCIAITNDSAKIAAAVALAGDLEARKITLDAVFLNAGITRFAPLAEATEALWDETFNVNTKGPYFQLKALSSLLNPGAAVVLNGSINAHIGAPGSSIYAASKAAMISLAKTLSGELLPKGVRVNVVSCGPIDTPLYGKLGLEPSVQQSTVAGIKAMIPLGRFGTPQEVASTVLHLAARESGFIVGTEIIIDGGMSQL